MATSIHLGSTANWKICSDYCLRLGNQREAQHRRSANSKHRAPSTRAPWGVGSSNVKTDSEDKNRRRCACRFLGLYAWGSPTPTFSYSLKRFFVCAFTFTRRLTPFPPEARCGTFALTLALCTDRHPIDCKIRVAGLRLKSPMHCTAKLLVPMSMSLAPLLDGQLCPCRI